MPLLSKYKEYIIWIPDLSLLIDCRETTLPTCACSNLFSFFLCLLCLSLFSSLEVVTHLASLLSSCLPSLRFIQPILFAVFDFINQIFTVCLCAWAELLVPLWKISHTCNAPLQLTWCQSTQSRFWMTQRKGWLLSISVSFPSFSSSQVPQPSSFAECERVSACIVVSLDFQCLMLSLAKELGSGQLLASQATSSTYTSVTRKFTQTEKWHQSCGKTNMQYSIVHTYLALLAKGANFRGNFTDRWTHTLA